MVNAAVRIEIAGSGLVYRNPKPYLRSRQAYHPSLAVFDDGEMLAAFDLAEAWESMDYGTNLARSTDGGRTWHLEGPVFIPSAKRPATVVVRVSRVSGGVVAFGGMLYRDDPDEGFSNRRTMGFVPMDLILLRSQDRGHTWAEPEVIHPPLVGPAWEICHAIVELPDGRWLAPTATWRGWNGEHPSGEQAVVLISQDGGKTWPGFARTFDGRQSGLVHWEQSVIPLQDGRILAVAWAHDPATGGTLPTPYSISHDGACTFSAPRPTGLRAQTCKVLQLRDGRILSIFRRDDQPGLWGNLSTLEGDRWINLAEYPIWQGAASGMAGHDNASDRLASLRFGFPTVVQLEDGDVIVVFWCVEDLVSNTRWFRLRVAE